MTLRKLPRAVWALGFVSLFMDISSEMIHALLPVYLVTVLGVSVLTVGWIEGVAEALAHIVKVFSGALADRWGRRKPLAVLGYGMAALTKPIFALATSVSWLVAARFIDRLGKGIRGAPRDALVADWSPPHLRGASFGLRQTLDTLGASAGPMLAVGLMAVSGGDFQAVFWWAVPPAFLSLAILLYAVHEPPREAPSLALPLFGGGLPLAGLGRGYWAVVLIGVALTMARFSEAFLVLRGQSVGLSPIWAPLALVGMKLAYSLTAYPLGALSDRWGRTPLLIGGTALLLAAHAVLAWQANFLGLALGVVLWGLHMAMTQGLLAASVADTAPAAWRGTAFGIFYLLTGLALLLSSVLAGWLWDRLGPSATFWAGALFAALACMGLILGQGRARKTMKV